VTVTLFRRYVPRWRLVHDLVKLAIPFPTGSEGSCHGLPNISTFDFSEPSTSHVIKPTVNRHHAPRMT
jgi:hypothetical protein